MEKNPGGKPRSRTASVAVVTADQVDSQARSFKARNLAREQERVFVRYDDFQLACTNNIASKYMERLTNLQ